MLDIDFDEQNFTEKLQELSIYRLARKIVRVETGRKKCI